MVIVTLYKGKRMFFGFVHMLLQYLTFILYVSPRVVLAWTTTYGKITRLHPSCTLLFVVVYV